MKILVTGAAGFLGTRLIEALLAGPRGLPPATALVAVDLTPCPVADPRVESRTGSIAEPGFVASIVDPDVDLVFHLAAVLSGQSEAEFDLGMRVNVDATRALLEACRARQTRPRFVFTSSIAVFGSPLPRIVPDDLAPRPLTSYGAAKLIGEVLVNDYARKGFVDGVALRLPTVAIRPGRPNSALSSFVSGIVREPLAGVHAVCPVPDETPLWICSPAVVIANLVQAARLETTALEGNRTVNLPGLSVTPAEMLASLERLGGRAARARVRVEPDAAAMRVVCAWPGAFDVRRPLGLGFEAEGDIDSIVRQFLEERGGGAGSRNSEHVQKDA
jgi:nucleoside-diphosphate-sugar epimerase